MVRTDKIHSQATLAALQITGVASVIGIERARICNNDPSVSACKSNGRAMLVSLSAPLVKAEVALVDVLIAAARTPTAFDTAQANGLSSATEREAWLRRISRPNAAKYRIELTQRNGTWVITKITIVGAT